MYAKIYEQIFDSSIADDWQVRHVFEDFVKLANRHGEVDMTHEAIARRTNIPIDIIQRAVSELEKVDPRSRNPKLDGRRIVRLDEHRDWGWRIVNHGYYRQLQNEDEKREAATERKRKERASKDISEISGQVVTKRDPIASASVSESVIPEGSQEGVKPPWTREEFEAAARNLSCPDSERDGCWAYYDSQGWEKSNGKRVQGDPRSLITSWLTNDRRKSEGGNGAGKPKRKHSMEEFLPAEGGAQ